MTPATVQMETVVVLSGTHLAELTCRGPNKPVILFLDSMPLTDVQATLQGDGSLRFRLLRGPASKANWNIILGRPKRDARPLPISVGYADGQEYPSTASVNFVALPPRLAFIGVVGFLALAGFFIALAIKSDIIRDPSAAGTPPGCKGPYSLALTQAAWWFFVVLGAYLLIGLVSGDFTSSLNGTALGLLAIGSGTAVSVAALGAGTDHAQVAQARDDATQALASANLTPAQQTSAKKVIANVSQGFIIDILTDADGVCFHRFQIVAWTLVLTGVFVIGVYENLAMPEFDVTLFGLLGLSSLTYIGLKNTEAVVPKSLGTSAPEKS